MKIVKLEAENIKRLVEVEIEPDGALVSSGSTRPARSASLSR